MFQQGNRETGKQGNRETGKQGIKFLGFFAVILLIAGCEMSSGDSGSSPSTNTDPTPSGVDLTVTLDRAANTATVTGDTGAVTLSLPMGGPTVSGTVGSPIDLTDLGLLTIGLDEVVATTANGSTRFAAMAPMTSNPNLGALEAKIQYANLGLTALTTLTTVDDEGQTLLSNFSGAETRYNSGVTGGTITEANAASWSDAYPYFTDKVAGIDPHLVTVNGTYILPNIAAILSYYETNTANADAFYEAMFKVWWNQLDSTNDAVMNAAIESYIQSNYPDVDSVE